MAIYTASTSELFVTSLVQSWPEFRVNAAITRSDLTELAVVIMNAPNTPAPTGRSTNGGTCTPSWAVEEDEFGVAAARGGGIVVGSSTKNDLIPLPYERDDDTEADRAHRLVEHGAGTPLRAARTTRLA